MAHLLTRPLGKSSLEGMLTQLATERKVAVLYFTAKWCGPCRSIKPVVHSLAQRKEDTLVVIEIDVDEKANASIVDHFAVKSMPTFIVIVNNTIVQIINGANEEALIQAGEVVVATTKALDRAH